MSNIDSENEATLARLNRERIARDLEPHIPPEHIVTGECTFEALNRYLTLHPLDKIRAIEAVRMSEWMYPLIKVHQAANPAWGLLDIIGGDPGAERDETEDQDATD